VCSQGEFQIELSVRVIVLNEKLVRFLAWSCLVAIGIATLAPIGFRPESGFSPSIERFSAFAALGLAFALAYPRHFWLAVFVALGSALLLEVVQLLEPSRHGRFFDAMVKVAGGSVGLVLGHLLLRLKLIRLRPRR
jgi:hypothetical protein